MVTMPGWKFYLGKNYPMVSVFTIFIILFSSIEDFFFLSQTFEKFRLSPCLNVLCLPSYIQRALLSLFLFPSKVCGIFSFLLFRCPSKFNFFRTDQNSATVKWPLKCFKPGFFNNVNIYLQLRLNNNIFNIVNTKNSQQQPPTTNFSHNPRKESSYTKNTWNYFCLLLFLVLLSFVNIALISVIIKGKKKHPYKLVRTEKERNNNDNNNLKRFSHHIRIFYKHGCNLLSWLKISMRWSAYW